MTDFTFKDSSKKQRWLAKQTVRKTRTKRDRKPCERKAKK